MSGLRLREGLIAGPDPEDPERYLIFCTKTGEHYELPAYGWKLARALDGELSFEALLVRAPELIGAEVEREALQDFLQSLERMSLLSRAPAQDDSQGLVDEGPQWRTAPPPSQYSLRVHPLARYECLCAGTCCESGYVITLTQAEAQAARVIGQSLLGPQADVVCLLPTRPERPWAYALSNEWTCPFLSKERRCLIHETEAHPATCKIFPLSFVQHKDEVFASVTHRCVCGAFDRGPPLEQQRAQLQQKLRFAKTIPVLPQRTRVDDLADLPTEAVVLRLCEVARAEPSAERMLRRAVLSLLSILPARYRRSEAVPLPAWTVLERLRAAPYDETDLALKAALLGRPHPNEGDHLRRYESGPAKRVQGGGRGGGRSFCAGCAVWDAAFPLFEDLRWFAGARLGGAGDWWGALGASGEGDGDVVGGGDALAGAAGVGGGAGAGGRAAEKLGGGAVARGLNGERGHGPAVRSHGRARGRGRWTWTSGELARPGNGNAAAWTRT